MNSGTDANLRILVVEDEPRIAELLTHDLRGAFPHANIETAATVFEAREKLRDAHQDRRPYDAAVLDCRLPTQKRGGMPEPDFSLGPKLLESAPGVMIFHITAHGDDPLIRRNLALDESDEPRRFFIPKDGDWMKVLTDQLVRSYYNGTIRRRYETMADHYDSDLDRQFADPASVTGCDRARSLEVAGLCVDAAMHWDLLYPKLQDDLKAAFGYRYDAKTKSHRLGVIDGDRGEAGSQEDSAQ